MKIYRVDYSGLWNGGTSFVVAESEEEAIAKVEAHPMTVNFVDVSVSEVDIESDSVFYNENGDC